MAHLSILSKRKIEKKNKTLEDFQKMDLNRNLHKKGTEELFVSIFFWLKYCHKS